MEQLNLVEAKRLSILKWESVKEHGDENHIPEECDILNFHCGFCQRWGYRFPEDKQNCNSCEFGKVAGKCLEEGSLWNKFSELSERIELSDITEKRIVFFNKIKDIANQIIESIKQIEE